MLLLNICLNIVTFIVIVCYPFALMFLDSAYWLMLSIMACFSVKFILFRDKLALISVVFFSISVCLYLFKVEILAYFYPTIINVVFLAFFAISLNGEAIITKIAKMQNPTLDFNGVLYTRKLTKIWCALFAFNALVGFALAFMEDKIYWSVFCGIVAYCLVGALFAVELLYRRFVLKRGSVRVGR